MTIQSSWVCPACGNREMHSDDKDYPYHDLWMSCNCSKCKCEFMVNVTSTEDEDQ